MATRSQTCTVCGRRWRQRDARFCGACGAMLDGPVSAEPSRGRRRALTVAARVVGVVGVVAAVATISTLDLARERPDTPVEVDDELTPDGPPLSAADRTALREQADPRQLRCEPRGCELWRLDRREAAFGNGIVVRDDGVLLGLRSYIFGTDASDEDDAQEGGRLLVAIDPTTGDELWARRIATVGSPNDWVQLVQAPGGALITSNREMVAVDDEGEVRWQWVPEPDEGHLDWWHSGVVADVILLHSYDSSGDGSEPTEGLTGLDAATGERLWTLQGGGAAVLENLIAVTSTDALRAIHPRTGEVLWERPGEHLDWWAGSRAPWVVTSSGAEFHLHDPDIGDEPGSADLHLIDPGTGEELSALDGSFVAPVVPVGDVWVGVLHAEPQVTEAGVTLRRLVALDRDGSTVWSTPIGQVDWPMWECCLIRDDPATGSFRLTDPEGRELQYDTATGELLSVEEPPPTDERRHQAPWDVWRPSPGLEFVWRDDGERLDIRTDDGAVTLTSGYGLQPESFDPIIVSDGRHLIGVQVVAQ